MTTPTGSNGVPKCEGSCLGSPDYYERGLELAEAGKYQEGLNCIREHLRAAPNDAQALNDAGAILHCLGRTGDAIGHLAKRIWPAGWPSRRRRCSVTWSGWAL